MAEQQNFDLVIRRVSGCGPLCNFWCTSCPDKHVFEPPETWHNFRSQWTVEAKIAAIDEVVDQAAKDLAYQTGKAINEIWRHRLDQDV